MYKKNLFSLFVMPIHKKRHRRPQLKETNVQIMNLI